MIDLSVAQDPTIGLLDINYELVSDGYTLFSPWSYNEQYLINNCGEKVHSWNLDLQSDLKMPYLDEDGNLWVLNRHDLFKYDWDGNLLWEFKSQDYNVIAHHDYEVLPNGNFIIIAWEDVPDEEAIQLGFSSDNDETIRVDGLYEYRFDSQDSFELVWKWNFKDHFVQETQVDLDNYGIIDVSPRRLELSASPISGYGDWLHCNGLDYNEDLDQLLISSRNSSEIYIIDHSTTTEEAASSEGGNQGYGGDFLWRWGFDNLTNQHDPNWIPMDHPNGGMITVFNNIDSLDNELVSSVQVVEPMMDAQGKYLLDTLNRFLPREPSLVISSLSIFSSIMSGVHSLANGNFIICVGTAGTFYELDSEGVVIWKYQNPVSTFPLPQFINPGVSFTFNIKKYPSNYIGLQGKDLSPKGLIEDENPLSTQCILDTDLDELQLTTLELFPNPSAGQIFFESEANIQEVQIFTVSGKMLERISTAQNKIELSLESGTYILRFKSETGVINKVISIVK